jgi:hypothetical protein
MWQYLTDVVQMPQENIGAIVYGLRKWREERRSLQRAPVGPKQ